MFTLYKEIEAIMTWIFTAVIGIIAWIFKGFYSEFKEMKDFYSKHKEVDFNSFIDKLNKVEKEISKVESESKRYWSEHKITMETNQAIIVEKINHSNNNNKATAEMLKEYFETIQHKMDKIQDKLDTKQDKNHGN